MQLADVPKEAIRKELLNRKFSKLGLSEKERTNIIDRLNLGVFDLGVMSSIPDSEYKYLGSNLLVAVLYEPNKYIVQGFFHMTGEQIEHLNKEHDLFIVKTIPGKTATPEETYNFYKRIADLP